MLGNAIDLSSDEIDRLTPTRDFSRRGFIATTVGSGFAAAVMPVTAQTIRTRSDGLTAGEVTIPAGDFKMPAYRAMPAGKTGLPVVLVVSEIFGVHEYIADVARRFALRVSRRGAPPARFGAQSRACGIRAAQDRGPAARPSRRTA